MCAGPVSGGDEAYRVSEGGLAALHFGDGLANDLLGQAGALAALAGDAERAADFTIAAAAFVNRIADLCIGDTFTEADVHGARLALVVLFDESDTNVNENACQRSIANARAS